MWDRERNWRRVYAIFFINDVEVLLKMRIKIGGNTYGNDTINSKRNH